MPNSTQPKVAIQFFKTLIVDDDISALALILVCQHAGAWIGQIAFPADLPFQAADPDLTPDSASENRIQAVLITFIRLRSGKNNKCSSTLILVSKVHIGGG
jgi:hypothetical protein